MRRHLAWTLTALLPASLAGTAAAQQALLASVDGLDEGGRFGQVLARAGDLDGDGTADILVSAPKADLGGDRRGRVVALSGVDLSLLFSIDGTGDLRELGTSLDGLGDVNGDGVPDLIVGEPWPYSGAVVDAPAHAYVCSGIDGSVLHTLTGSTTGARFGAAVAGLGDVDGDGVDDVAVSEPGLLVGSQIDGRVALFSGATGAHLFDVPMPEPGLQLGAALASTPDRNGDGVRDLLIGATGWKGPNVLAVGAVYWISGADGAVIALLPGVAGAGHNDPRFMGRTLGALGDVDGDGWHDVWGGAEGLIRIWSGQDGGLLRDLEAWTDTWDGPRAADLGDLTGDGRAEVLLADPEAHGGHDDSGRAALLDGATAERLAYVAGAQISGKLGSAVLVLGDNDGNGRPEVLLGRPHHAGPAPGAVLLFELRPQQLVFSMDDDDPDLTLFGSDVRSAGDVDNDGVADVIVGEPYDSTMASNGGRARVFSGRDGATLLTLYGHDALDRLGWAVDEIGDVDGDGHDDLAVGLPFRPPPAAGAVRVVSGANGATLHELVGVSAIDRFGLALSGVGDVDGDGVPDLAVGAPYDDLGGQDTGALRIYSGASGSLIREHLGTTSFGFLGHAVDGGRDVEGDGVPDLLVSAPGQGAGTATVFSGATGDALVSVSAELANSGFGLDGTCLALVDDLDGDGLADLVTGAPLQSNGTVAAWSGATGHQLWDRHGLGIGQSVAAYPDVDGDGLGEILVGAQGVSFPQGGWGEAWLLSGADGLYLGGWPGGGSSTEGSSVDTLGDRDFDGWPDVLLAGDGNLAVDGSFSVWLGGDGSSPWQDLGGRLPGAAGTPTLTPVGSLAGGSFAGVDLAGAPAFASTTLVIGLSQLSLPFKGGVLVPAADILVAGLSTDGDGALIGLGGTWPVGVPAGIESYYQAWFVDGGGPLGLSATQGVVGITP